MPHDFGVQRFPPALEIPEFIRHDTQYPAPEKSPSDTPARCYHIQIAYVSRLVALCDYFAHSDAFSGTLEERERAAAWFVELQLIFLTGNADCGGEWEMQFRQNPDNVCQMQWRANDGEAWNLMFDYALCLDSFFGGGQLATQEQINIVMSQQQSLNVIYDGTIASIAPNMVYDSSPRDDYRDLAICAYFQTVMAGFAEFSGTYETRYSGWYWDVGRFVNDLMIVVAPVIALIGVAVTGGVITWPFYLLSAVAVALAEEIGPMIEEYDLTPLNDEGLILQILCLVRSNLAGDDVSEAEFNAAFNGADLLPGMNADTYDALVKVVSKRVTYLSFLDACSQIVLKLESGEIEYTCPCSTWEKSWDFEASDGDYSLFVHGNLWSDPDPDPRGEWVNTEGWETRILESARRHLNIHNVQSIHWQCVGIEAELAHPAGVRTSYQVSLGVGLNEYAETKVLDENPAHTHLQWDGLPFECNCVLLEMSFNGNVNSRVRSITVRGIGEEPSWLP
jgi:hypothetical protein